MENKDELLPIGTIVLLKGGKKELMITSYYVFPSEELYENGQKLETPGIMYEYGACTYPEGIINRDEIYAFNHDKIERICYQGYASDAQKEYVDELKEIVYHSTKAVANA